MLGQLLAAAQTLTQGLLQLLYPGVCWVCGRFLGPNQVHFCPTCRAELAADGQATCPRCAATVGPYTHLVDGCRACRGKAFAFDAVLRLGPYEGKRRDVVLRLKHAAGEALAEVVGELWAGQAEHSLRQLGAHVVIPIPLHWRRRWQRGYNQSETLAGALASRLELPCRPGWLRRIRPTPKQTQQTPANRALNVRDAFRSQPRIDLVGKTVLLVDDVFTTGATVHEAARALRAAGAGRVVVAVLTRAETR